MLAKSRLLTVTWPRYRLDGRVDGISVGDAGMGGRWSIPFPSKRAGADWAKARFGPAWADLIDRAWGERPNPAVSVREPADPADYERTLELVQLNHARGIH